ncbi:MAG TPA: hypothetical protein VNW94_10885 [Streptosporangiaceae bacterium]|nr:hypothetical protein [Streptosporangiaceae bacterium]
MVLNPPIKPYALTCFSVAVRRSLSRSWQFVYDTSRSPGGATVAATFVKR